MSIPLRPSLANYFAALRVQFADPQAGFLPQCFHSHKKKKMKISCGYSDRWAGAGGQGAVAKALWTHPPDSLGGFGGLGVVLMGDFAQLLPVLSSSLMFGAAIEESQKSGLRLLALAGRQTFASFQHVIRSV